LIPGGAARRFPPIPKPWRIDFVHRGDKDGALAQLGERLHGMQEVSGSIPLGSTILSAREPPLQRSPNFSAKSGRLPSKQQAEIPCLRRYRATAPSISGFVSRPILEVRCFGVTARRDPFADAPVSGVTGEFQFGSEVFGMALTETSTAIHVSAKAKWRS
jgi:hypothetical protein